MIIFALYEYVTKLRVYPADRGSVPSPTGAVRSEPHPPTSCIRRMPSNGWRRSRISQMYLFLSNFFIIALSSHFSLWLAEDAGVSSDTFLKMKPKVKEAVGRDAGSETVL